MSVHVSSLVYRAKLGGSSRKAVALKLADCAHDDGSNVYPSVARIANEAEVSPRTVQRVLRDFVSEGLLIVVREGGKGPRDTTEYRFSLDQLVALSSPPKPLNKGDKLAPLEPARVTKRVTPCPAKGDTVSSKGDTVTPEPSLTIIEPSLSARAREGVSKSENSKVKGNAMDCVVSEEARSEARKLAHGWDIRKLEEEWREWNAEQDNVIRDPDRAFVEFCRKRGTHKGVRKFKLTTPVSPELRAQVLVAGPGERIIDRMGPDWQAWLDHLRSVAPELEGLARRSFAMAVKSQRPYPGCELPRIQSIPKAA
jgi:helix-turn-helix protein